MRLCSDEVTLFHAFDTTDATQTLLIVEAGGVPIPGDGPTTSWAQGVLPSTDWRDRCHVQVGSLWEQMELLLITEQTPRYRYPSDGHEAIEMLGQLVARANRRLR